MATGALANVKWGLETTFGTKATTIDKLLGYAVEVTSSDVDNNPMPRRGLGSRNIQAIAFGEFKGSMSLKFDLVDPFLFRVMTGGYATSGAGPYEYTFAEETTLPSFSLTGYIENIDGGADTLRTFLGCVVLDWTLDVAVGNEPITVTLNIAFADVDDLATTQTAAFPTNLPLTFAHASWQKDGTTVAFTENVSLKCNQNTEMRPYLGSRFAVRAKFGDREYEVSTTHYYQTPATYFDVGFGAAGGPTETGSLSPDWTLEIIPESGITSDTYTFSFTDGWVSKVSQPIKVGEDIMEEVTILAASMELVVDSATTAPTF